MHSLVISSLIHITKLSVLDRLMGVKSLHNGIVRNVTNCSSLFQKCIKCDKGKGHRAQKVEKCGLLPKQGGKGVSENRKRMFLGEPSKKIPSEMEVAPPHNSLNS